MLVNDLIDIHSGERKYLNREERQAFRQAALYMEPPIRTFCLMMYYTGCRLGEALEVTPDRLDFDGQRVLIRTLKQNRRNSDRADRYILNFQMSIWPLYKAFIRHKVAREPRPDKNQSGVLLPELAKTMSRK